MALWQVEDWKVAAQSKPLPRGAAHTVLFTHHGAAACGEEPCLLLVRCRQTLYLRCFGLGAWVPAAAYSCERNGLTGHKLERTIS